MTARFKDFGNSVSPENAEPIVFKLNGEEFTCIPTIQGKVLLELVSDSGSDDLSKSSAVTLNFFSKVLVDESLERFNAMLSSKDKIVSLETITAISAWLIEEYTSRPLGQSEAS